MSTGQAAWREEGGRWGSPEDGRNPCPSVASGLGSVGVLGIDPYLLLSLYCSDLLDQHNPSFGL